MQRGRQVCDDRWLGSHKNEERNGAFYTNCRLAEKFCEIVHAHRGDDELYEMGVGEGAIFARLHEPKTGVELQDSIEQKFASVTYGVNALTVTPPSKDAGRHVTVVMNPPFNRYKEFFNHASTFANRIVWIVGPNVRLWTNEDGLNSNMHLVSEWLVPDDMCGFTSMTGKHRKVKSIIQIWEWRSQPRRLWCLKSCLRGIRGQEVVRGAYVVKKVGKKDVGTHLKLKGHESEEEIARIGTLRKEPGPAMILTLIHI